MNMAEEKINVSSMLKEKEITTKKIDVRNLDTKVTVDDLIQLFGLSSTPFLKRTCSVELITTCDNELYAHISVPEHVYSELLKLNGSDFHGREIVIQEGDNKAEEPISVSRKNNRRSRSQTEKGKKYEEEMKKIVTSKNVKVSSYVLNESLDAKKKLKQISKVTTVTPRDSGNQYVVELNSVSYQIIINNLMDWGKEIGVEIARSDTDASGKSVQTQFIVNLLTVSKIIFKVAVTCYDTKSKLLLQLLGKKGVAENVNALQMFVENNLKPMCEYIERTENFEIAKKAMKEDLVDRNVNTVTASYSPSDDCQKCNLYVDDGVQCDICNSWLHFQCTKLNMSREKVRKLKVYTCEVCSNTKCMTEQGKQINQEEKHTTQQPTIINIDNDIDDKLLTAPCLMAIATYRQIAEHDRHEEQIKYDDPEEETVKTATISTIISSNDGIKDGGKEYATGGEGGANNGNANMVENGVIEVKSCHENGERSGAQGEVVGEAELVRQHKELLNVNHEDANDNMLVLETTTEVGCEYEMDKCKEEAAGDKEKGGTTDDENRVNLNEAIEATIENCIDNTMNKDGYQQQNELMVHENIQSHIEIITDKSNNDEQNGLVIVEQQQHQRQNQLIKVGINSMDMSCFVTLQNVLRGAKTGKVEDRLYIIIAKLKERMCMMEIENNTADHSKEDIKSIEKLSKKVEEKMKLVEELQQNHKKAKTEIKELKVEKNEWKSVAEKQKKELKMKDDEKKKVNKVIEELNDKVIVMEMIEAQMKVKLELYERNHNKHEMDDRKEAEEQSIVEKQLEIQRLKLAVKMKDDLILESAKKLNLVSSKLTIMKDEVEEYKLKLRDVDKFYADIIEKKDESISKCVEISSKDEKHENMFKKLLIKNFADAERNCIVNLYNELKMCDNQSQTEESQYVDQSTMTEEEWKPSLVQDNVDTGENKEEVLSVHLDNETEVAHKITEKDEIDDLVVLKIVNLPSTITKENIENLFGLNISENIKEISQVIMGNKYNNTIDVRVIVPKGMDEEVNKINGMKLNNRSVYVNKVEMCKLGKDCKRKICRYGHKEKPVGLSSNEKDTEKLIPVSSNSSTPNLLKKKTQCKFGPDCRFGIEKCNFRHDESKEMKTKGNIKKCTNGNECKYAKVNRCKFLHNEGQSKTEPNECNNGPSCVFKKQNRCKFKHTKHVADSTTVNNENSNEGSSTDMPEIKWSEEVVPNVVRIDIKNKNLTSKEEYLNFYSKWMKDNVPSASKNL